MRMRADAMINGMASPADQYHCWYYDTEVWLKTTFLGIPSMKSVSDMWNYQEILSELKPALVLELGTGKGGSTLYFAGDSSNDLAPLAHPVCRHQSERGP